LYEFVDASTDDSVCSKLEGNNVMTCIEIIEMKKETMADTDASLILQDKRLKSCNFHSSLHYQSSCLAFKTRHFGDWILCPSSG
jgi:hypothetical protein